MTALQTYKYTNSFMIILNNRRADHHDSGEASFVQQFVAPPSLLASQLIVPVSPLR